MNFYQIFLNLKIKLFLCLIVNFEWKFPFEFTETHIQGDIASPSDSTKDTNKFIKSIKHWVRYSKVKKNMILLHYINQKWKTYPGVSLSAGIAYIHTEKRSNFVLKNYETSLAISMF